MVWFRAVGIVGSLEAKRTGKTNQVQTPTDVPEVKTFPLQARAGGCGPFAEHVNRESAWRRDVWGLMVQLAEARGGGKGTYDGYSKPATPTRQARLAAYEQGVLPVLR